MSTKKSPLDNLAIKIKKDIVDYIGPIFQELKGDMKVFEGNFKVEINNLNDKINWQSTLIEQLDKKFDVATGVTEMVRSHNLTLNHHSEKIGKLEQQVSIKKPLSPLLHLN